MSWLSRRLALARRAGERGGVAAVVSVVLGGGVLLGMGALVIDVGQMYVEREELQSGADAAVTAVAAECVRRPSSCGVAAADIAQRYVNGNASDGSSGVSVICGRAPDGTLPACPPDSGNLTACIGAPPATGPYAEVRTVTRRQDGSTVLPPAFARALAGKEGEGSRIGACARAAWGPPLAARGFGATISRCEWEASTSGGARFAVDPSQGVPDSSYEQVIHLHDTGKAKPCPAGPGPCGPATGHDGSPTTCQTPCNW